MAKRGGGCFIAKRQKHTPCYASAILIVVGTSNILLRVGFLYHYNVYTYYINIVMIALLKPSSGILA